ncbi:MAG: hypothetical protein EXR05_06100 [Acetobacteraceae bacterium]|nr:hypothetical protein [Acetobacteraceae bacterium]
MNGLARRALLLGSPLLLAAAGPDVPAARPLSRMDLPWWRARHQGVLERLRQGSADLLLIGDSITQDLELRGPLPRQDFAAVWDRFYAPRHAVNLGFKGDTTASVIWRLRNGEISGVTPRAVQLLIGANNLGRVRWDAMATFAGIEAIVTILRQRLLRTKIIVLSVLPSRRSPWVDTQTKALNRMLAERFLRSVDARFIDVSAAFLRHGVLDETAFYDGALNPPEPLLHPSAAAWLRIAEIVEPTLSAMMGDRAR